MRVHTPSTASLLWRRHIQVIPVVSFIPVKFTVLSSNEVDLLRYST